MWIILCMLFFMCVEAEERPSFMCDSEGNEDCSFQLLNASRNSCQVYKTSVCLNQFSNVVKSGIKLRTEIDSKFSVSINPYSAVIHELQKNMPMSAINITISIFHKDIKYFIIMLKEKENKTICRIMDFQSYSGEIPIPTTLFYDCFYMLVENNIQNVSLSVKSMPMNEELNYYVFIPPAMTPDTGFRWQPLIMIYSENLSKGIVSIKFSQAPSHLNISYYSVNLFPEALDKGINFKLVNNSSQAKMLNVEFSSIEDGTYYIVVSAIFMNGAKYLSTKTPSFEVKVDNFDKSLILYICIVFLLTLSIFSIVKCVQSFLYPDFHAKCVLLVYSIDCEEHGDFVSSFASYLTNECNLIVTTIYGDKEIPHQWIRDKYRGAEVIIFIVSEGLFLTFEGSSDSRLKFTTHWHRQLKDTVAYILQQIFNSDKSRVKKFCKVYFPHTSIKFVPSCLRDGMGNCYELPKEFNQLLCFIFNCKPLIPFIKFYPKLKGCNPQASNIGQEMLKYMKVLQVALHNKSHLLMPKHILKDSRKRANPDEVSPGVFCHSTLKGVNYLPVKGNDSESCEETEFSNPPSLVNWLDDIKQVHSNSVKGYYKNCMTPFVEKDLFE